MRLYYSGPADQLETISQFGPGSTLEDGLRIVDEPFESRDAALTYIKGRAAQGYGVVDEAAGTLTINGLTARIIE